MNTAANTPETIVGIYSKFGRETEALRKNAWMEVERLERKTGMPHISAVEQPENLAELIEARRAKLNAAKQRKAEKPAKWGVAQYDKYAFLTPGKPSWYVYEGFKYVHKSEAESMKSQISKGLKREDKWEVKVVALPFTGEVR